jgi:hypothetical protein
MGYTFTWDDIEKICQKLGMKKQGKTSVWKGIWPDGVKRTCVIHAKHKGNVGAGLVQKIATRELGFASAAGTYVRKEGNKDLPVRLPRQLPRPGAENMDARAWEAARGGMKQENPRQV